MKAIMLMFDSLNRHMLSAYGCDWTHTPNFKRLARRAVTFEKSYICSMPCMPARRELHTGRPNFLHCGWGPLQPYDDSMPELLKNSGIYTHLTTDHYHYWEDGGATYHGRYDSYEFFRGQEGDPFIGYVAEPEIPPHVNQKGRRADWVNRMFIKNEDDYSQPQTIRAGLNFIHRNHEQDRWFLQIECFDPHEPFTSPRKYKDIYPHEYDGPIFDWPPYGPVREPREQVEHARMEYAALLSMCDAHLGKVLDAMDRHDLWKDTMLIVWTDHGFMLGEHDHWAKRTQPWYEELAHTPFFIWDPRCGRAAERCQALIQPALDLAPTLLDFFGIEPTSDMLGKNLRDTIAWDAPVREAGIFGQFGDQVNVTDGRYFYMRSAASEENQPLFAYTLMPTLMRSLMDPGRLQNLQLAEPFSFTKGCRTLRIPSKTGWFLNNPKGATALYDLQADPSQTHPLQDPTIERQMMAHLTRLMRECDAPPEQFERLGLKSAG